MESVYTRVRVVLNIKSKVNQRLINYDTVFTYYRYRCICSKGRQYQTGPLFCSDLHWFSRKVLLLPLMTNSFEVVLLQKGFQWSHVLQQDRLVVCSV